MRKMDEIGSVKVIPLLNKIRTLIEKENKRYAEAISAADYIAMTESVARRLTYMHMSDIILEMWYEESGE